MPSPILLAIPKPCHEDWDNMTAEGRGRFCSSCSKQVIDFSLMTDQEVLNYFSKAQGKTCGRFTNDQLQRPLTPLKEQKKQTWWMAMMLPLLFFFDKANAQKKKSTSIKERPTITRCEPKNPIMGKVAFPIKPDATTFTEIDTAIAEPVRTLIGDTTPMEIKVPELKTITVKGKITDALTKQPVSFASVVIKGQSYGVTSDADGNFKLVIPSPANKQTIYISSVGYKTKEIPIELKTTALTEDSNSVMELNEELTYMEAALSGEVVVVGYTIEHKSLKKKDNIATSVRKLFRSEIFKTYPNPVTKGGILNIQFKKTGDYTIELLDNNSKLIEIKEYKAAYDAESTSIPISSALTDGVYYIRVIDERAKKQFTNKIIVQ